MRKLALVSTILLLSSLATPASAETCSTQITLTFHQWSTTADTPLVVADPGAFSTGAMPSCAWHYTEPLDVTTGAPAGTITNVSSQGGFTFTPAPGYVGTAYFQTVSDAGEFQNWPSFIMVSAGGGGGSVTKDACKNGGWRTLTRANGSAFKNEGDCVSYAVNGK